MTRSDDSIEVLFVDDEPDLPDLVATKLEEADDRLSVVTARTVEAGMDEVETRDIDCIVADYDLPKRDGIDFLESVREDHPRLPFILYTGKGSEGVASDAISKGVTDYFQKGRVPNQYEILANRIANAVAAERARQAMAAQQRELQTHERLVHSMLESACIYGRDQHF
ncbi:MAG: response regulator, partial [Halodesulfurarchaeum sp.]